MAAGIKFGRKRKLSDYQRAEAIKRRAAGETLASIAKSYGVHLAMISRRKAGDTIRANRRVNVSKDDGKSTAGSTAFQVSGTSQVRL
jgi:hypothetical protein